MIQVLIPVACGVLGSAAMLWLVLSKRLDEYPAAQLGRATFLCLAILLPLSLAGALVPVSDTAHDVLAPFMVLASLLMGVLVTFYVWRVAPAALARYEDRYTEGGIRTTVVIVRTGALLLVPCVVIAFSVRFIS